MRGAVHTPTLFSPSNGANNQTLGNFQLVWTTVIGATFYHVQLSTDSTFSGLLVEEDTTWTDHQSIVAWLDFNEIYYWRVRAIKGSTASVWTKPWSFSTPQISAPRVTLDSIPSCAIPVSGVTYITVTGKVNADIAITAISYQVLNSGDQLATGITLSGPAPSYVDDTLDFTSNPIMITVHSTAIPGDYKLKISVTAGFSVDTFFNFTLTL